VTVAVEAMTFHLPVFVGDEVSCYCETERLGRTSIAVHVETWVRRDQLSDDSIKVTEAVYTYVAIDEDRKPIPIKKPES
jgi:acyl-CoA thioesterase YciA